MFAVAFDLMVAMPLWAVTAETVVDGMNLI
jgi:hypothetical protein